MPEKFGQKKGKEGINQRERYVLSRIKKSQSLVTKLFIAYGYNLAQYFYIEYEF